jgi:hypothetical protein
MARVFGVTPDVVEARLGEVQPDVKYDPVMKFDSAVGTPSAKA